jgi:hypothetical protein
VIKVRPDMEIDAHIARVAEDDLARRGRSRTTDAHEPKVEVARKRIKH